MPISSDPEVAESPDLLSVRSRRPPASKEPSQQSTTKAAVVNTNNKSVVTSNFDIDISDIEDDDDDEGPDVIPNSEGDAVDEGAGLGGRGGDSQKVEDDFEEDEEECAVEYNRQAFSPPNTEMLQEFLDDEQQTPQLSGKTTIHDMNLKSFKNQL